NGYKLQQGKFQLEIRKKLFIMQVVKYWNRLSNEAVESPFLELFKTQVDKALSNQI
ncbi:hypothetical protein N308_11745, partial [Struthio camelus australis]